MNPAELSALSLDLMICGGILLVFLADLFLEGDTKKSLGALTALILVSVFGASFVLDTSGVAVFGKYQGGEWPLFLKRVFLVAGLIAVLGSLEFVHPRFPRRQGEYYLMLLSSILGMMLLPGAQDLILLLVCFELMGLPLYVLAAYAKNEKGVDGRKTGPEAALKLYLVGAASTAITLFGITLIYGLAGSTMLSELGTAPQSPLLTMGLVMVLAGMGFKIGMVPFHMWVPDTYEGASTPFVAFLSVAPKLAGFSAMISIFIGGFSEQAPNWVPLVLGVSFVTMLLGNLLAIPQKNIKRLLAFSGYGDQYGGVPRGPGGFRVGLQRGNPQLRRPGAAVSMAGPLHAPVPSFPGRNPLRGRLLGQVLRVHGGLAIRVHVAGHRGRGVGNPRPLLLPAGRAGDVHEASRRPG
jgi:NADH-quinone oxidoreductase subunit N